MILCQKKSQRDSDQRINLQRRINFEQCFCQEVEFNTQTSTFSADFGGFLKLLRSTKGNDRQQRPSARLEQGMLQLRDMHITDGLQICAINYKPSCRCQVKNRQKLSVSCRLSLRSSAQVVLFTRWECKWAASTEAGEDRTEGEKRSREEKEMRCFVIWL